MRSLNVNSLEFLLYRIKIERLLQLFFAFKLFYYYAANLNIQDVLFFDITL